MYDPNNEKYICRWILGPYPVQGISYNPTRNTRSCITGHPVPRDEHWISLGPAKFKDVLDEIRDSTEIYQNFVKRYFPKRTEILPKLAEILRNKFRVSVETLFQIQHKIDTFAPEYTMWHTRIEEVYIKKNTKSRIYANIDTFVPEDTMWHTITRIEELYMNKKRQKCRDLMQNKYICPRRHNVTNMHRSNIHT